MGMLVAMVLSMGAMGTVNSENDNVSMQQISCATGYGAGLAQSEGNVANFVGNSVTSAAFAGGAISCIKAGIVAGGVTPTALACFAGAGVCAL